AGVRIRAIRLLFLQLEFGQHQLVGKLRQVRPSEHANGVTDGRQLAFCDLDRLRHLVGVSTLIPEIQVLVELAALVLAFHDGAFDPQIVARRRIAVRAAFYVRDLVGVRTTGQWRATGDERVDVAYVK